MKKYLLLAGVVCVAVTFFLYHGSVYWLSQGEQRLSTRLDAAAVSRIEICRMPPWLETPMRVSGESLLERCGPCRVEITDDWLDKTKLSDVLYNTAVRKATTDPDARLALAFYNRNGERMATFYFDSSGEVSDYNNTAVKVRGKLFTYAKDLARCR
jgi:hypothetical protein